MRRRPAMPIRRLRGCNAGAAAAEFALIALPVVLLALGTFDYFAATYETTAIEAATRGLAEDARDDPACGSAGFGGGAMSSNCSSALSSLWSTMQSGNNTLSGATFSPASDILIYYTCTDNSGASTTPPTCSVPCGTGCTDTRVVEYVQVSITQSWWQFFPWDPWSSTNPLVARMSTRIL